MPGDIELSYHANTFLLFVVALAGAVVWSVWRVPSDSLIDQVGPLILLFAVSSCGGLASQYLRKRRDSRDRSDASESVEVHAAHVAQAKVFFDGIVGAVAVAVVIGVLGFAINAAVSLLVWAAVMVIDYWIRFAIVKRRLTTVTVE